MTDLAQELVPLHLKPGKHNMASAAFAEVRAARREGRDPEGSELSFGDLLDTVNPLQHIPVVSEAYRHLTGDRIGPGARVAGGLLYGGPIGAVASVFSLAVSGNGEMGVGDRLLTSIVGAPPPGEPGPAIAAARKEPQNISEKSPEESNVAALSATPASPSPLARTASTSAPALPRLSPDAFQALIGSFADPDTLREANLELIPENTVPEDEPSASLGDAGLMSAMQQAMDKYDALKPQPVGSP